MGDSKVLSSDFPDLRTSAASMTSTASTTSMASMTFTASFCQKITDCDGWIIPGTKMTITRPFLWNGSSKIKFFLLILALFLSEAVEASRCYFFENWKMTLKCPLLLRPLESIRIIHFTMRHPVHLSIQWCRNS